MINADSHAYFLSPKEHFHHAHGAWISELDAANIRCQTCTHLSWPSKRPRRLYLDGINKATVSQSAWPIDVQLIDASIWAAIAQYIQNIDVFEVYLPTKRITEKLRRASAFDPEQFTLRHEWVGITTRSGPGRMPVRWSGHPLEHAQSQCKSCGHISYAVPQHEMYILSSDWGSSVCRIPSCEYLLMNAEILQTLHISTFKGTRICKVPIVKDEPPIVKTLLNTHGRV